MANLVITPAGGSAITFLGATAGLHRVANKYWGRGVMQDANYALELVTASNVDGALTKRHGFRDRGSEPIEVVYISATSAANCMSLFHTDEAAMKNKSCTVAMPDDATYYSCEVISFKALRFPKKTEASTWRLHCQLVLKQLRLT